MQNKNFYQFYSLIIEFFKIHYLFEDRIYERFTKI